MNVYGLMRPVLSCPRSPENKIENLLIAVVVGFAINHQEYAAQRDLVQHQDDK